MSIIEIAKIQVRRGLASVDGVPQLDGGEMGWAIDAQELWIGNGTTAEGAPTTGNTRLLTTHDLGNGSTLAATTFYTYATPGHPTILGIPTSIQSKLDTMVSLVDFSTQPTDTPADTRAGLQLAIDTLYNNIYRNNPETRLTLFFPPGKYSIDNVITIPGNVSIQGAGKNKTIINLISTNTSAIRFAANTSTNLLFGSMTGLQHPSTNTINGISFQYDPTVNATQTQPLLLVDCMTDSVISDCTFSGTTSTTTTTYAGISIRGQNAITTKNLSIIRSDFYNMNAGIISNYDINDITVSSANFNNLYQGIVFSNTLAVGNQTGPTNVRVSDSTFDTIMQEAWYVGSNPANQPTYNISTRNSYRNVGNNGLGDLQAVSPVIRFNAPGNVSRDDYFSRHATINSSTSTVTFVSTIVGNTFVTPDTVYLKTFTTTSTPLPVVLLPYSGNDQSIVVSYILRKPLANVSRKGRLMITTSFDGSVALSDNFSYTGSTDGGMNFSATLNTSSNTVSVLYTSSDSNGSLEYKFEVFQ